MKRPRLIQDERGMTLIELLVATAAGVVVMFGVVLTVIVVGRETQRVSTHVNANQRARVTMYKIIDQLHSACVAPQISPIRTDSTSTMLSFLHQTGSGVAPTPVLSKISLTGTTLSQSNYTATTGSAAPSWAFNEASPSSTVTLMTNVSAISASVPIFRYYAYENGQISATPFTASPLGSNASKTVQVSVAFKASPIRTTISDSNAPTSIQDSAILRLTPPSYSTSVSNLPCQ